MKQRVSAVVFAVLLLVNTPHSYADVTREIPYVVPASGTPVFALLCTNGLEILGFQLIVATA
jgi:hypothetical protein